MTTHWPRGKTRNSLKSIRVWLCTGRWGLDTTERLHFHFSLSCIGKGNGNPLQCSCLENPRDRGAWWAAVYGVAQSRTRLKQLSSSSCTDYQKSFILKQESYDKSWEGLRRSGNGSLSLTLYHRESVEQRAHWVVSSPAREMCWERVSLTTVRTARGSPGLWGTAVKEEKPAGAPGTGPPRPAW